MGLQRDGADGQSPGRAISGGTTEHLAKRLSPPWAIPPWRNAPGARLFGGSTKVPLGAEFGLAIQTVTLALLVKLLPLARDLWPDTNRLSRCLLGANCGLTTGILGLFLHGKVAATKDLNTRCAKSRCRNDVVGVLAHLCANSALSCRPDPRIPSTQLRFPSTRRFG